MARRTPPSQLIGSGLIPQSFLNEDIGIEDTYQSTLANLGKNERSLFQDYGFQGGIGEGGAVNFQIDPTNSRGQYQQLLQSIGNQLGQAKTEVRGRGLGRAGLAKAREGLIRYMMSGEKSGLLNQFNKSAADIFGQRGGALTAKNRARNALEGSALDWWNQYGPDDPDGNVAEPAPSEAPAPSIPQLPQLGVDYGSKKPLLWHPLRRLRVCRSWVWTTGTTRSTSPISLRSLHPSGAAVADSTRRCNG
jgi:hypothetical protein